LILILKSILTSAADFISSPFRLYFEIRKNLRQMNVPKIEAGKVVEAFRLAYIPFLLRDLSFRFCFESIYHSVVFYQYYAKLRSQRKIGMEVDNTLGAQLQFEASQKIHMRSGLFLISSILACMITNPLDVVTTRLICQQKQAYSGMLDCFKTIIREEGIKKLWFSGFGPRSGFMMIHGSIMLSMNPRVLRVIEDAYSLDNIIN
jgi:hypothetical protein